MARCQLRLYNGPTDEIAQFAKAAAPPRNCMTMPLGEVLHLLVDAVNSGRTWLPDFEEDNITISTDLYEVLLAYEHYRRPGA
jgi:hypothetical protein